MITFYIIILLIIFLYYYFYIQKKKTIHKFWDNQPVSRNNITLKTGIISSTPFFKIKMNKDYKLTYLNPRNSSKQIVNFINTHFSKSYQYTENFLINTLGYNKKGYNVGLFYKNSLIGFIHSKPVTLSIKNDLINLYYVDYLCIHNEFRNRNLAAILISKLINDHHDKSKCFIFKKDKYQLPFNYITSSNYYYLELGSIHSKIENINVGNSISYCDKNNLTELYQFIITESKTHECYQYFNEKEFIELYSNSSKKIIIERNNKKEICGYLIYINIVFRSNSDFTKTVDIENMFLMKNSGLFDFLIKECNDKKIKIISCLDISKNNYIINKYQMNKSFPIFYHMYNYHISNKILKKNLCFNYL